MRTKFYLLDFYNVLKYFRKDKFNAIQFLHLLTINKHHRHFPSYTHFFYKHMNFLAEAFAKHILCLFFSTKAFMCYVLNFFEKKSRHMLIHCREMCLFFYSTKAFMCLLFSTKAFLCYVLNFFEKIAFMCLIDHVLIKNEYRETKRVAK